MSTEARDARYLAIAATGPIFSVHDVLLMKERCDASITERLPMTAAMG